jgi:hypothetical protein
MEKTHTLIPTKRFIFFFMLRNKEMALLSQHLMLRNGRHREWLKGCVGMRLNVGVLSPPFPAVTHCFQCSPPKNVGVNTACHPGWVGGGWGSRAVVKRLMPIFNKWWVQCVSWRDGGKGVKGLVKEAARWERKEERLGPPRIPVASEVMVLPLPLQHHPLPSSSPPS